MTNSRTRGKGLLELVGLVRVLVLEGEGVQVARAADLELDGVGGRALDHPGGCSLSANRVLPCRWWWWPDIAEAIGPRSGCHVQQAGFRVHVQEASFLREISRKRLMSETSAGILTD